MWAREAPYGPRGAMRENGSIWSQTLMHAYACQKNPVRVTIFNNRPIWVDVGPCGPRGPMWAHTAHEGPYGAMRGHMAPNIIVFPMWPMRAHEGPCGRMWADAGP